MPACQIICLLVCVLAQRPACLCLHACLYVKVCAYLFVCIWHRPAPYISFTRALVSGPSRAGLVSMVLVNAGLAMPTRLSISSQSSAGWLGSSTLCKCVACWKTSRACSFGTTGNRPTSCIYSTTSRMCPTHSLYDCCKAIEKNGSSLASVHCKRELTQVVLCQDQVTNAR